MPIPIGDNVGYGEGSWLQDDIGARVAGIHLPSSKPSRRIATHQRTRIGGNCEDGSGDVEIGGTANIIVVDHDSYRNGVDQSWWKRLYACKSNHNRGGWVDKVVVDDADDRLVGGVNSNGKDAFDPHAAQGYQP